MRAVTIGRDGRPVHDIVAGSKRRERLRQRYPASKTREVTPQCKASIAWNRYNFSQESGGDGRGARLR